MEDFKKISANFSNFDSTKINERLEWQNKQIAELMPLKIKNADLESQIEKMKEEIKTKAEHLEVITNTYSISQKLIKEKDNIIQQKNNYIKLVESKFADVKDYIFRNFSDKLEDFNKWINFGTQKL